MNRSSHLKMSACQRNLLSRMQSAFGSLVYELQVNIYSFQLQFAYVKTSIVGFPSPEMPDVLR